MTKTYAPAKITFDDHGDAIVRIDPELKKDWVAALMSGDYKQGHNALKRITGDSAEYCCLGIICELVGFRSSPTGVHVTFFGPTDSIGSQSWMPDNRLLPPEIQRVLADLNDGDSATDPMPFELIAGFIQENL